MQFHAAGAAPIPNFTGHGLGENRPLCGEVLFGLGLLDPLVGSQRSFDDRVGIRSCRQRQHNGDGVRSFTESQGCLGSLVGHILPAHV